MQSTLKLTSQLKLDRLIEHWMVLSMPSTTTTLNLSFLFSKSGQVCSGLGWSADQIVVSISTKIMLEDCYKYIIQDLTDWRSSWTGENAKWVDDCSFSGSNEQTIILKNWQVTTAITDMWFWGGNSVNGNGCFIFAQWSTWAPDLVDYVNRVASNYESYQKPLA